MLAVRTEQRWNIRSSMRWKDGRVFVGSDLAISHRHGSDAWHDLNTVTIAAMMAYQEAVDRVKPPCSTLRK